MPNEVYHRYGRQVSQCFSKVNIEFCLCMPLLYKTANVFGYQKSKTSVKVDYNNVHSTRL